MSVPDVVVVGGGHNALVAATYLARDGLEVTLLERLPHVGGAAISARPWDGIDARLSRFSYLVSLMPQALVDDLGLRLELRSRPTASFTPYVHPDGTPDGLLVETDPGPATEESFRRRTGTDAELSAWNAFYDEVGTVARAVEPTLLGPLPHVDDLRAHLDPQIWTDLVEAPLGSAVRRRFHDDLVRGVVSTDALIGTFASLDDPSLVQNRCFLYHLVGNGTGEWRVPVGGMGAVTGEMERAAREAGVEILTDVEVTAVEAGDDSVTVRAGDRSWTAPHVLSGIAPWQLERLQCAAGHAPPSGAQFKVNLLVSRLPRLRSGIDPAVAFAGTFHVNESFDQLEEAHRLAAAGTPTFASGELYCHTLTDRSILGPDLAATDAQTLTYFGLHTPYENLTDEESAAAELRRVFAATEQHLDEPLEPLVVAMEHKTPRDVESMLAMPGGHIFHGDLAWPWLTDDEQPSTPAERWGVATSHPRVLVCGSGSRRGGAVSGLGGHHAAHALLETLA